MATPTKADPLFERMEHAFGQKLIAQSFHNMTTAYGCNLLDYLTDEARDELARRCIISHKIRRRYAAESRRNHKARAA